MHLSGMAIGFGHVTFCDEMVTSRHENPTDRHSAANCKEVELVLEAERLLMDYSMNIDKSTNA